MNISLTPNRSAHNLSFVSQSSPKNVDEKHSQLIEKYITDLEELTKRLLELQTENPNEVFSDDCVELQKLCFKFEFLIQFRLKEKKSFFETNSLSVSNHSNDGSITAYTSKDYWTFFLESLKSSRGFQDAIKYVRNIPELKTNIGRGRAFIRFCLQFHRLADAIQQIMMDQKLVNNWYKEKAVWYNESQKSRIFQFLYDLTEINFDLISKSNFELDTTWPSVQLNNPNNPRILITRHRTNSITSYTSYYQEKDHIDNLSSTPHDLEGEFLFQKMNKVTEDDAESVDIHNTYQLEIENHESKIAELTNRLALKESQLDTVIEELKKKDEPQMSANGTQNSKHDVSSSNDNDSTMFLEKMAAQITFLNDQLASKVNQNLELNDCLIKQTSMCENLSELLRQSQDKLAFLDADRLKNIHVAEKMQDQFDTLNKDYNALKLEYSKKKLNEETLVKETLSQTQSIVNLKQENAKQEAYINQLKIELDRSKEERQREMNENEHKIQQKLIEFQLKAEENYLLNEQIQKLNRQLVEEQKERAALEQEMSELTESLVSEKNSGEIKQSKIDQLEDDNNEIKKRLVKLIKEKAELWQKADNLEYENLLKVNQMWVEDANATNCLTCHSQFSLLLRKHHCRMCLKIFCYYCCNNWIDYNGSKQRLCQRCFESKGTIAEFTQKITKISTKGEGASTSEASVPKSGKLGIEAITSSSHSIDNSNETELSDPDTNFEVRPERLNLSVTTSEKRNASEFNSAESDDPGQSIYETAKSTPAQPKENTVTDNSYKSDVHKENQEKIKEALQNEILEKQEEQKDKPMFTALKEITTALFSDETSDLVVRKKKIIKKKKKVPSEDTLSDDFDNKSNKSYNDSFTILTQDEINKVVKNE